LAFNGTFGTLNCAADNYGLVKPWEIESTTQQTHWANLMCCILRHWEKNKVGLFYSSSKPTYVTDS